MLSVDGAEHARHREPFAHPFRPARVRNRFTGFIEAETDRLISTFQRAGGAELRRQFAGPLAVAVVTDVLGLRNVQADIVWRRDDPGWRFEFGPVRFGPSWTRQSVLANLTAGPDSAFLP